MEEILDAEIINSGKENIFSKLAFGIAILSIILCLYLISFVPRTLESSMPIETPRITPIILLITTATGLLFSILSITRKERLKYIKPIGIGLNFLTAIAVFGPIIFARIMDYLREVG